MPPWKKTGLPSQQQRMDAEEGRAKLKTTSMTTKSTEGRGRGMGVRDWLPKKPKQKAPDGEDTTVDAENQQGTQKNGQAPPTDLEKVFAKYGMKPPDWMEKVVPEWLSRRLAGRKKKRRKRKDEPAQDRRPKPLAVPKTLGGMLWIKFKELFGHSTSGIRARYQYRKRLRQLEGPGPLEQAATEFVVRPTISFAKELREHGRAYFGVNKGFKTMAQQLAAEEEKVDPDGEPTIVSSIITWHQLEDNQQRIQTVLAFLAVISIFMGIAIHEQQFRGFIPGWDEDCANPAAPRNECFDNNGCFYRPDNTGTMILECQPVETNWDALNQMKVANSLMTALMAYSVYVYYNYEANIISLRNHIDFSDPRLLRYSLLQVGLMPWFCLELMVLTVHQIPYVSHDIIVNSTVFSGRPSVYSLDGILALLMIGRLLQVFRWYRGYLFVKYQSRRFASRLNEERMTIFLALRLLVLEGPFVASSHFLLGCVAFGSYFYRIAESSTNPTASIYYWDSLWFVVDTLTGLPVADSAIEPKGQFGRTIAFAVRVAGIFWFVMLVNSFRHWMRFRPDELQAQQWLRLSTRTNVVRLSAVRLIQHLWLYGKNHWATLRQLRRFQRAKARLQLFEDAGQRPEMFNFDAFLRAITVRRSENVKLFEEKVRDLEEAYQELDYTRAESVEAASRPRRKESVLQSIGAMAQRTTAIAHRTGSNVVSSVKQAPQRIIYASTQAVKKVGGSKFGAEPDPCEAHSSDEDDVPLPGQPSRRREPGAGVWGADAAVAHGARFGAGAEFDKAEIRRARRASRAIVTGDMNYEVILSAEEKVQLKDRTLGLQLSDALKELRELRDTNEALLLMLGQEPERVKPPAGLEPEVKLQTWEVKMSTRLDQAEDRFAALNQSMSECMGQLMVLIGGLYAKKEKEQKEKEQKVEKTEST